MNVRIPILSITAVIHIIYNLYFYLRYGRQNDEEGWGQLWMLILVGGGIAAIVIDIILYNFIKQKTAYLIIGTMLIIIGYMVFYAL